jgi:hypothetical protein
MAATRSTVVGSADADARAAATMPAARPVRAPSLGGVVATAPWLAATASACACWQTAETGMPAGYTSAARSSGSYKLIFGDIPPT